MDGVEHEADAIIFATGFDLEVMTMVMELVMMMEVVVMLVMMLVIMMVMSRQARSLIRKKGLKGSWLRTMGMHPLLTSVV